MINLNKSIDIRKKPFNKILISFTIQFIILNSLNILFGYYILIPFINGKYSKIFKNIIRIIKFGDFKRTKIQKQEEKEKIKQSHKDFMRNAFNFFKKVLIILLIFNVFVFMKTPKDYKQSLFEYLTFKNIGINLVITFIVLLLQLLYFNHFTFPYYINCIMKYFL